jgi:hypothetical protein
MVGVNQREDWPLGPALRQRRERLGLSVKAAARRTSKAISDGRWYQLESGYQQIKGQLIPIGTTPATVAAAARAVEWDPDEALRVAGFDPALIGPRPTSTPDLSELPIDALFDEIRRRADRKPRLRDDADDL